MSFTLPELKYDYNALEPHIDEQTMKIHHTKHHQAYVDNLNKAVEGTDLVDKPIEELIRDLKDVPEKIKAAVRNNGGGHLNHGIFWEIMAPGGRGQPKGELLKEIEQAFGSFDKFKEEFENAGKTQFGSGWAWLVLDGGKLAVVKTPNQDNPITDGKQPIMGVDVWEHAYYLKYQNRRPEYLTTWWNTVNWDVVADRFEKARQK